MPMAKQQHMGVELDRWARHWGVPFRFASRFPINTTKALRAVLLAPIEKRADVVDAIFEAAWGLDRDVSNDLVLEELLTRVGCDAKSVLAAVTGDDVKRALKEATEEAERRGVFGVPTFFVRVPGREEEMFWGQDRIPMIEAMIG
jgi:2-hydroxychromene-2-carboxylate isomerase